MTRDCLPVSSEMERALGPTADPAWLLREQGYDHLRESSFESRFAISNGFLGVRGGFATDRGACHVTPPCTYVAGLFDTPSPERPIPELVEAADWLQIRIALPAGPLRHCKAPSSRRLALDMRRGVMLTEYRHARNAAVAVRLRTLRLVSMRDRAIAMQLIRLEIEAGTGDLTFEASFGAMKFALAAERTEADLATWRTWRTDKGLAMAAVGTLQVDGDERPASARGHLLWSWTLPFRPGQVIDFQRIVAVTRDDACVRDPGARARSALVAACRFGWRGVLERHEAAWVERWRSSEVVVQGDPAAQTALRFAAYHLNGAADPGDDRVSIAARALTGDDYHGHVFWDTEIFLLPFYILTWPEAARALLMYRFRTLDAARAKAAAMGWRGALYAWESADTGAEATPTHAIGPDRKVLDILCGTQEQHISADVAYAVWQYWLATGDESFLLDAGAEIILETARFWASRARPEADGHRHIRGVIGPDEYHEGIDDNAFTNVMARSNIKRGLEVAALLDARWPDHWAVLSKRLGLDAPELTEWSDAVATIETGFHPDTGLFEQFAGYSALEQIDLAAYPGRSVPMDVILGRERIQRSQVVKQADVVALLALMPEAFPDGAAATNFDYYEPRCGHGSSLSRALHGVAAARLGRPEVALRFFRDTAAIDLSDTQAPTGGGVHIAALGGLWLIAIFGFAGLSLESECLGLRPQLPKGWTSLAFRIRWRSRELTIAIDQSLSRIAARLERGSPMTVIVDAENRHLTEGQSVDIPYRS